MAKRKKIVVYTRHKHPKHDVEDEICWTVFSGVKKMRGGGCSRRGYRDVHQVVTEELGKNLGMKMKSYPSGWSGMEFGDDFEFVEI